MNGALKTLEGDVAAIPVEELLGHDLRSGAFSLSKARGEPRLFGPGSPTKVKLRRGMLQKNGRLRRMGELIAEGRRNKEVIRALRDEGFPPPDNGVVNRMRRVVEAERGKPFLCPCGQPISHHGYCPFKYEAKRQPRTLTVEDVIRVRQLYAGRQNRLRRTGMTMKEIAETTGLSPTNVIEIIHQTCWKPIDARTAKYKVSLTAANIRKAVFRMRRVCDLRRLHTAFTEPTAVERELDPLLVRLRDSLSEGLALLEQIEQIRLK